MSLSRCTVFAPARLIGRMLSLCLLAGVLVTAPVGASTHNQVSETFLYTGAPQAFNVPPTVTELTIEAWGAQGGDAAPTNPGVGGLGGYAKSTVPVLPGETLHVYVGGRGDSPGFGGWNGGGDAGLSTSGSTGQSGGGGGASDVRQLGTALTNRVIVAGGGGGGGYYVSHGGGGGGGGYFGGGGAGGAAHQPPSGATPGQDGTLGLGGDGGQQGFQQLVGSSGYAGGDGGGSTADDGDGWPACAGKGGTQTAGGAGGDNVCDIPAGGGGGSNLVSGSDTVSQRGVRAGHGEVRITYTPSVDPLDGVFAPQPAPPCSNSATRVDTVSGSGAGYSFEIDIHHTPTALEVCTHVTNPSGGTIFREDVVVPTNVDPFAPLPEVDADAPPGDGTGSPCTEEHAEGGTTSARAYLRTSDTSTDEPVVCFGVRGAGTERHVRVTAD